MDIKRLYIELFPLNIDTYAPNEYQLLWVGSGEDDDKTHTHNTHARYDQKRSLPAITIGIQCNLLNYTWNFFHSVFFSLSFASYRFTCSHFCAFCRSICDACTVFFSLLCIIFILCRVEKYTTHHVRSFITFFTWIITATTLNKCILMLLFGAVHFNFA